VFYLTGLIIGTFMSTYFAFPQPVLLYVCPFMIFGPLYVAKFRKEDHLMLKEGILGNAIAEQFVTKLLGKIRASPNRKQGALTPNKTSPSRNNSQLSSSNTLPIPRGIAPK